MRAEINRGQLLNKFKNAEEFIDEAKRYTLYEAAGWIITRSPVDTGVYMENHNIGLGNNVPPGKRFSTVGEERNQNWQQYADEAMERMSSQIEGLPKDFKRASIGNNAQHVEEVEYTHGYGVFTSLRAAWPQLKEDGIATARARYKK